MQGAEVLTKFTADSSQMDNATKNIQEDLEQTKKKGELAFLGLTTAFDAFVGAVIKGGIEYNAQMQTFNTRLTTLTGSADEADKVLSQIKKDALTTPFDVASLTQAESLLLSTGVSAENARKDILALGDAVSASGGGNAELQRMAVNLQQIKNVGKASSLDIKQFAYAGIDIYGLLADSMGVSREEATDLDVTYEMLSKALQNANSKGGKYYKAMEKQSKTYNGAMSNLQESLQVLKGTLAEGLFNSISKLIPKLTDMFDWLAKNKDIIVAIAVPLLTFVNTLAGVLIVGKITLMFKALWVTLSAHPIGLIVAGIASLVTAFTYLWNNCEGFRNFWVNLWGEIKNVASGVIDWFKGVPQMIGEAIDGIIYFITHLNEYIGYAIGWTIGALHKFLTEDLVNFVFGVVNYMTQLPGKIWNICTSVIGKIGDMFSDMWKKAKKEVPKLVKDIISWFGDLPKKIVDVGKNIVKGLWDGINKMKDWVINKIKGFGKAIVKGLKDFLGIKSPSKEFAIIGEFSAEGYVEGLEGMQKEVDRTIGATFNPFSNNTIGSMTTPTPTANVTINNSMQFDPLGQLVNNVKTFSGGAKNDYNYVGGY